MIFLYGVCPHIFWWQMRTKLTREIRKNRQNLTLSPQITAFVPVFKTRAGTLQPAPRMVWSRLYPCPRILKQDPP